MAKKTSILDAARKAAGREKKYNVSTEKKAESVIDSTTKRNTGGTSSIIESARKASGRGIESRPLIRSAPVSSPSSSGEVKADIPSVGINNTFGDSEKPTDYSSAVKYLNDKGIPWGSGIMTEREWQRRKGANGGTYQDYLDNVIKNYNDYGAEYASDYLESKWKAATGLEVEFTPDPTGGEKNAVFKSGGFSDGYQLGDVTRTATSTVLDLGGNFLKGVGGFIEGITDLGTYGVAGIASLLGQHELAEGLKYGANWNITESVSQGLADEYSFVDNYSLIGNYGDKVPEGLGYIAGILATKNLAGAAGLGSKGVSAVTNLTMGASSMGSGMSEAYQGGATDGEAVLYGLGNAFVDVVTESLFGGLGKGVKALGITRGIGGLDDMFAKKLSNALTKAIKNPTVQKALSNTIQFGVKSAGEGTEELLAGLGSAVMKKLTYMSEEDINQLIADEQLLEQFVYGTVISSFAQAPSYVDSTIHGEDYISDVPQTPSEYADAIIQNEESLDALIESGKASGEGTQSYELATEIETARESGQKVTNKQVRKLVESINIDMSAVTADDTATGTDEPTKTIHSARTPAVASAFSSTDIEWSTPDDSTPIAYSSRETSKLIDKIATENPNATINELNSIINDADAQQVMQRYIAEGYGEQVASEWFNNDKDYVRMMNIGTLAETNETMPISDFSGEGDSVPTELVNLAKEMVSEQSRTEAVDEINKVLGNEFQWVDFIENGTFRDSDVPYYNRKPTEADAQKFRGLQKQLIETGDSKYVDELSALREEIQGKPIPQSERARIDKVIDNVKPSSVADNTPSVEDNTPYNVMSDKPKAKKGVSLAEQLEAQSQNNEEISVADVQKATGFGEQGATLVANLANTEGRTFRQAERAVKTAYLAGYTDLKASQVNLTTNLQKSAFDAGKIDRGTQDRIDQAEAREATIYDGTFTENEYTKNFSEAEKKMISIFAKALGMDISVVDKIIANVVDDVEHEANASHYDGKMEISQNTKKVLSELVLHEGGHRMKQLAPKEFGVLMNALYARSVRENSKRKLSETTGFDDVKAEHDNVSITMDTSGYFEEFAVRELENLFASAEEFNQWYAEISGNTEVKSAWQKFVNCIKEILAKVKRYIDTAKMSPEDRAKAKARFNELKLFENAFKAAENVVRNADTKNDSIYNEHKRAEKSLGKFSLKEIVDENGKSYGIGVVLDSTLLENLTPEERVDMVKEYVKELGGRTFNAYDSNGNEVVIKIAESNKHFMNKSGKNVAVNKDLTSYLGKNETKQEAITLIDELIVSAKYNNSEPAKYSHGWVDNNGENNWDYWTTYIQDKNNTIWEARLNIANSTNGEKILYDIFPIKKVGQSVTSDKSTTNGMISQEPNFVNKNFSLKDSDGKTLSAEQQEYFKDSKVRDEDGNLLVAYHGTDAEFTTFDADFISDDNKLGIGFYFMVGKKLQYSYANVIKSYLNIANPITEKSKKLSKEKVRSFCDKLGVEIDYFDDDYDLDVYQRLSYAYTGNKKTFLKEAISILGVDGVYSKERSVAVAFSSDQAKLTTNKKPTSNPDIRYSLKAEDINKLSTEEQKAVTALGKGAEAITNKNGDMLIATNKNKGTVMYSLKTYQDGGKEALEKALRANGHTEEEVKKTLSYVDDAADYLTILAAGYAKSHNYNALADHLIADVITNVKTGKQVISSIVNNGEYPVNIDLALICKKRVAYMNLMNRLIDDGIFDKVNYGGEAIAKVNGLLRMDGFETACLGCFVESRRLQFQSWAETIVSEWNAEVDKRTKNAEKFNFSDGNATLTDADMDALAEELKNAGKKNAQGNLNLGRGSVQTKMGRLLDKVPSLRKHLTVADLLKPNGLTALRAYDSNLFSIVKSRYGAASPKIVQDYNPYASEISMLTFASVKSITSNAVKGADFYRRKVTNEMGGKPVKQKGETDKAFKARKAEFTAKVEDEAIRRYLYDIGGARIQSFSDFMIENVFDYIQIFADLSAKRLPLHGYTKEIVALRLFGMTGAKWNGSWIAHVDRSMGKEYAGLLPASEAKNGNAILVHTKDGDYAIGFDDYARYKASNKKTFIQSIGMKDMIALQLDTRYSPYVGSITIGVSDKQILAMLDSPLFRFVIPYHSSGMLPQFAKLVGVDLYNDYQDYQNTTVKEWFDAYGNPCEPISGAKVDTSYNFNAEFQKTGDAKKAADNYLKWCEQKHPVYDSNKKRVGYVTFNPKFSNSPYGTDFSKHENYYKMLEDFNSYDNITEEPAVQGAVTMNFPSEDNRLTASEMESYKERLRETGIYSEQEIEKYSAIANKTFKELIADEVKGRAEYQKAQTPKWENTVKNVEEMLLADHKRSTPSNSLKGSVSNTQLLNIVDDARKGKGEAIHKLSKYVDRGVIPTELYEELITKYGAIPAGENPSRDITVPKKTAKDKKVSQTVRTILEAKATPDEVLPTIEKMVEDGVFSYETYTDKQAIADAEDYLKGYGWVETLNDWMTDVNKGIVSKQHTVMGWALYNNAVNTATTSTDADARKTAMQTAFNVLDAMVRHQRNAAQALQATRVLKKLSPEAQLYGVQKSVNAFQKELTDKYGKKAPYLKINEELAEQFLTAESEEERVEIEKKIYKDIGRQMPSRFIDRWNAWRYLAMLGNPRTHVRNILGNAFFTPVVAVKNLTATAIESMVAPIVRWSGKKMTRSKSIVWGSKSDRKLLKAAYNDYANVADVVSNGGKYNESARANQYIEEGRKVFKSKLFAPVEWARKGNSKALEAEDVWFSKPHYAHALAQYCKANNITAEQIARGKAIAPAREYAIKEAQKATYKDTNAFSQFVSSLGRGGEINHVPKVVSMIVDGILPFRKTPANILVRGVEYSPIGLLKGLTDIFRIGKENKSGHTITATEVIDNISAGLTGTGLVALGLYLAAQGLLRGHGEDDEEERKFKEMQGHQAYSLELPNGASVTLDWLAPEALPVFVGVNIWETATSTKEDLNFATILQSVTHITEPMLEMSCLQSLNDLIDGIGYASSNDTSAIVAFVSSAATSYLMQGIPTLFGQYERTAEEEYRMTTYTEKNNFLTGDMQYALGKASAKIPFWDYNQIPYIDAWGRKEASGSALKRAGHNFLNPAYTSTIEDSKAEKELLRLYEKTGDGGVFPSRADKYFVVDGVRKDLTADEYVDYATKKGQKSYKAVTDLVNSKAYKKLSDTEKAEAIKDAYTYADQKAKKIVTSGKYKPQSWVEEADGFSNVGNYISFRTEVASTKEQNGGEIGKLDVVDIVLDMAQNDTERWKMYLSQYDSKSDMYVHDMGVDADDYMNFLIALDKYDRPNEDGDYGTYTGEEYEWAIDSMRGLTQRERAILRQSKNPDGSTKNNKYLK